MHKAIKEISRESLVNCSKIVYAKNIHKLGRISGFRLWKIKDGKGPNIIIINGFLNQNETDTSEWEQSLKRIWPDNPWHCLSWESKELKHMLTKKDLNIWSTAMSKAETTGQILGNVLAEHNSKYILCGHSLGARVIYYALNHLAALDRTLVLEAHLLGGAVGSETLKWKKTRKAVSEMIVNYRSDNDDVLRYLYSTGTMFEDDPVGRHRILVRDIVDIDTSRRVQGHSDYKKYFAKYYPGNDDHNEAEGSKVKISFSHNKTDKNNQNKRR